MTKPPDHLFQSVLRTFVGSAFGKRVVRRDLALLETSRGIDKWCINSISHLETAFDGSVTKEVPFRSGGIEFYKFIHGPVAAFLEQAAVAPVWIVYRKLSRGNYCAVHEAVSTRQALEALESTVSILLIFDAGRAWIYANEDNNVYLSLAVARAIGI